MNAIRKHWLKKLVPIVLVIVFFDIALNSLQTILAPDITLLFETLKQLKR